MMAAAHLASHDPLQSLALKLADALASMAATDSTPAVDRLREEESLLAARVAQDPHAMQVLYERYYPRILNYLYRRTMDRDLAEELTSQTFLQAFDALRRREQSAIRVCPWLYRIATNAHVSHARSLGVLRRRLADIAWQWLASGTNRLRQPDRAAATREEITRLRDGLAALPEKYRSVLLLRFDEELSTMEIAEVLGLTPPTVRKRIERAIKHLQDTCQELRETER